MNKSHIDLTSTERLGGSNECPTHIPPSNYDSIDLYTDVRKRAVQDLVEQGRSIVTLGRRETEAMKILYQESERFFRLPFEAKASHQSSDFNFGYRPFGRQYSVSPDKPDMNESFTFWRGDRNTVARNGRLNKFMSALEHYQRIVSQVSGAVLDALAEHFSTRNSVRFYRSSYIEINYYLPTAHRHLLQDRHEDGHLLTLLVTDGAGLEVECDGVMTPVGLGANQLLIMPGSLLTALTGGLTPPLYHQVRNQHLAQRISMMYFVNPQADERINPYVQNDGNRELDIAALARANPLVFGLPEPPKD